MWSTVFVVPRVSTHATALKHGRAMRHTIVRHVHVAMAPRTPV